MRYQGPSCNLQDETLAERLWGLTEMFPEPVRNVSSALASVSMFATKSLYSFGRNGIWIAASSAIILALPVLFEMERSQMEEQQLQQQRQVDISVFIVPDFRALMDPSCFISVQIFSVDLNYSLTELFKSKVETHMVPLFADFTRTKCSLIRWNDAPDAPDGGATNPAMMIEL